MVSGLENVLLRNGILTLKLLLPVSSILLCPLWSGAIILYSPRVSIQLSKDTMRVFKLRISRRKLFSFVLFLILFLFCIRFVFNRKSENIKWLNNSLPKYLKITQITCLKSISQPRSRIVYLF